MVGRREYNTSDQDEKDSVLSANSRSNKYFPRQGIHDNLHRTPPPNLTTASSTSTRSSSASRDRPNWQQQSSGYSSSLRSTGTAKDRPSASRGSRYNNNSTINDNNPAKSLSADQDQRPMTVANTSSRSSSASKTRLNNNINKLSSSTDEDRHLGNQQHSHVKPLRQSVSPSMTKGRNSISIRNHKQPEINNEHASTIIVSSRGRNHPSSGGSNNQSSHNLFGSKMVDKVMNARRSTTLSSVAVVNKEREISHKQNARGFASSSLMINNEVAGFRKSSPSSAAQNQDKFESSTSSSSLPISNEKPSAGILKTSSDMALRDSKDTREINHQAANLTRNVKNSKHDHSSIRRAIEQSRVCMNVEVIKLTTVTGDKKGEKEIYSQGREIIMQNIARFVLNSVCILQ
ncbi:probable serine/threonine-protein kinase DDB_G0283065 [Papaver somniferum]|uniref:probable serine/threonine-protein kinase DDB_G0283065 n=1 Tax=Papaver somniferum TaxID=3469 RepID=UPI000E6F4DF0|nr:probable serine/threonine-protein kinase DDB_G0283065 [Papaver somniferum]